MENNNIGFEETNAGELTPQQEAAVAMVLEGKSDTEISRELKMRRQTVNEWRNHHTAFRMEVKQRRSQAWETAAGEAEPAGAKGAGHAGRVPGARE